MLKPPASNELNEHLRLEQDELVEMASLSLPLSSVAGSWSAARWCSRRPRSTEASPGMFHLSQPPGSQGGAKAEKRTGCSSWANHLALSPTALLPMNGGDQL